MTADAILRPEACVLCGGPNQCGIAAGRTECWCTTVQLPQALLDRVPLEYRNTSCICQGCIASFQEDLRLSSS